MMMLWTVIALGFILYGYAMHCRTRAYCRVCDLLVRNFLVREGMSISTLEIHRETGVSVGYVCAILDELERKGLVHSVSVPAGHLSHRRAPIRLIYLGPQMGETK